MISFSERWILRSSFKSPENGEVYLATAIGDLSAFPVDSIDPVTIREEWLPEEGLLYGQVDHESELVKESIERNRTVLHFALEKVDTADRNAIPVVVLGKALDAFQRMVMHAFRKELSQLKKVEREQWKSPAIYQLVAFAASPGSFRLHLEPEAAGDLFGESEILKRARSHRQDNSPRPVAGRGGPSPHAATWPLFECL